MKTEQELKKRQKIDVQTRSSSKPGLSGLFETALRKFRGVLHAAIMGPFYALACLCTGTALIPGIALFQWVSKLTEGAHPLLRYLGWGTSMAAGFFLFGFSLLFLMPAVNWIFRANLKPWRGPYYSLESVFWYIHNGATYLLRYTFLEFITPTPFNALFYRMMGMKIGRGTVINTTNISDPSLIEMGDKVTIGGSVTIVGHYGQSGFLVLAPVRIGSGSTIGLKSTLMGGVTIGENCKILPNSVVLPNSRIPDGETWGGVPAQKITFSARAA